MEIISRKRRLLALASDKVERGDALASDQRSSDGGVISEGYRILRSSLFTLPLKSVSFFLPLQRMPRACFPVCLTSD